MRLFKDHEINIDTNYLLNRHNIIATIPFCIFSNQTMIIQNSVYKQSHINEISISESIAKYK